MLSMLEISKIDYDKTNKFEFCISPLGGIDEYEKVKYILPVHGVHQKNANTLSFTPIRTVEVGIISNHGMMHPIGLVYRGSREYTIELNTLLNIVFKRGEENNTMLVELRPGMY